MLPEQVWDEADRPDSSLRLGKPAGSAVPLVWAHAEYLKLLRSHFTKVVARKPKASRDRSSEQYLVGLGKLE